MADPATDHALLRTGTGARWIERDALAVRGADAVGFLQGQCSQDVVALAVGTSAWSFVLQPQGKVDALVRISRVGDDELVVDVDGGFGEALLARLQRFKLRVAVEIEPQLWRCLALRGPGSGEVGPVDGATLTVDASWPGLPGVDVFGPAPTAPASVAMVGVDAWEAARIEAGVPAMGSELTERTIPGETGIVDRTVSFTKGCFTGQELVARIDSRGGHVARRLCGVVLDQPFPPGTEVRAGGRDVGALTSVAPRPGGAVALAYIARDVDVPADVEVGAEGGARPARVEALPLDRRG